MNDVSYVMASQGMRKLLESWQTRGIDADGVLVVLGQDRKQLVKPGMARVEEDPSKEE
jgi:hypothetical protein